MNSLPRWRAPLSKNLWSSPENFRGGGLSSNYCQLNASIWNVRHFPKQSKLISFLSAVNRATFGNFTELRCPILLEKSVSNRTIRYLDQIIRRTGSEIDKVSRYGPSAVEIHRMALDVIWICFQQIQIRSSNFFAKESFTKDSLGKQSKTSNKRLPMRTSNKSFQ